MLFSTPAVLICGEAKQATLTDVCATDLKSKVGHFQYPSNSNRKAFSWLPQSSTEPVLSLSEQAGWCLLLLHSTDLCDSEWLIITVLSKKSHYKGKATVLYILYYFLTVLISILQINGKNKWILILVISNSMVSKTPSEIISDRVIFVV